MEKKLNFQEALFMMRHGFSVKVDGVEGYFSLEDGIVPHPPDGFYPHGQIEGGKLTHYTESGLSSGRPSTHFFIRKDLSEFDDNVWIFYHDDSKIYSLYDGPRLNKVPRFESDLSSLLSKSEN